MSPEPQACNLSTNNHLNVPNWDSSLQQTCASWLPTSWISGRVESALMFRIFSLEDKICYAVLYLGGHPAWYSICALPKVRLWDPVQHSSSVTISALSDVPTMLAAAEAVASATNTPSARIRAGIPATLATAPVLTTCHLSRKQGWGRGNEESSSSYFPPCHSRRL